MSIDDDDITPQARPRPRALSRTDAERLAAPIIEASEESKAHERVDEVRLLLAEYFGHDGKGGRFIYLETTMQEHAETISELKDFKHRVTWTVGVVSLVGGTLAGLALLLVEHWLK